MGTRDARIVLALDTSTDMLCCAVGEVTDEIRLVAERDHLCRRHANEQLVSCALEALDEAGYTMEDVDEVVCGRGPGSFTGVRIGVACAKGISVGQSVPLYGTSTLDACAWHAWESGVRGTLAVALDAMRSEIYPGIYELSDTGVERTFASETVLKADECIALWAERSDVSDLIICGNALIKYRDRFEDAGLTNIVDEELWYPSGLGLLRATWTGTGDPALVLPIYTRLSDAEENERKRLGLKVPESASVTGVAEGLAGRHLQLRPMSVNDLNQVAELEGETYAHAAHEAWSLAMFEDELALPGRTWWVAHDGAEIVGFAGAVLAGDTLEILDVVVSPARRREHIASRLLRSVAYDGHVLGAVSLSLEVEEDNEAAQALYESLGLSVGGRRPNYYGPGVAALIMVCPLPLTADIERTHPEPAASIRPWPIVAAERSHEQQAEICAHAPLILAIESSCDETALAVIDGSGMVLSNVVATQIDFHSRFGGVVPEIASRKHVEAIVGVFEETMERAGHALGVDTLEPKDLAAVGVTAGPGLVGALVVGVAFAKGLAGAANLPLVPVHHLEGHLFANLFETPDLEPPFVASLVSGGNTMLVHVRDWGDYEILGQTIDDAVGEAYDKVAKALGLGYPGGPVISKLSKDGNPKAIAFPRAMLHSGDYRFSLSGLKTAVITYIQGENKAGRPINLPDLAASFEAAVIDVQVAKAVTAINETGASDFCVGGGVAANPKLREAYRKRFGRMGVRVTVPPFSVCGDNGAMIALVALRNYRAGVIADLSLDASPNAKLGEWSSNVAPIVSEVPFK